MAIKKFHHADLIIARGGEGEAKIFYCDLLGLREIPKPEVLRANGGLWLAIGDFQLHLSYEKKEGVDPRKTKAHLAFVVDDLARVERSLLAAGCSIKWQEQLPGMIRLETEDPFGHRLELLELI